METLTPRRPQLLRRGRRRTSQDCPAFSTQKTGTSLEFEQTEFATGTETPHLYLPPLNHPQGIEARNPNFLTNFDQTDFLHHHLLRHRPHHHPPPRLRLQEETARLGHEKTHFLPCQRMRSWIGETGCGGLEQPVKKRRRELQQVEDHFQTGVAVLREAKRRRRMCTMTPKET